MHCGWNKAISKVKNLLYQNLKVCRKKRIKKQNTNQNGEKKIFDAFMVPLFVTCV